MPIDSAEQLRASLDQPEPPAGLAEGLRALWLDEKGEFDAAHDIAQRLHSPLGAQLHAYLHRKEGDLSNAQYWYRRADVAAFQGSLEAEWNQLAGLFAGE